MHEACPTATPARLVRCSSFEVEDSTHCGGRAKEQRAAERDRWQAQASVSVTMAKSATNLYPRGRHDWLLPFYDPFVKLMGGRAGRPDS